jgi:coenzyme F420-reducing hydrogenase delta subunit
MFNIDKPKKTELSEQQKTFLTALFGQANGNAKQAAEMAGYSESYYPELVRNLKEEIINRAEEILAAHSPKAALGMIHALDEDGSTPGVNIRMEAAKQILDRVGVSKKERIDMNVKQATGIFILPPKNGTAGTAE